MNKTKKYTKGKDKGKGKDKKKNRTFKFKDYKSGDGMLTTVWGPGMWHYMHTMSFNYPLHPTNNDKKNYRDFIINLQYTLPCRHCRVNLKKNFKEYPLKPCYMKNRDTYSRYIYNLHEKVNKLLGKNSGLSYCDIRERYEHFRSRCTDEKPKMFKFRKTKRKKEKGCTEPLYGKKSKCVIKIIPQDEKCKTLQIDKQCLKKRE
jgi:hypothetical protein